MTGEWAPTWSYQWLADIGVPAFVGAFGAIGTIAVGAGAVAVAVSSNRIAKRIANREYATDSLQSRVAFGAAVLRWADRLTAEIRVHDEGSLQGETADELKAGVDAAAAAFDEINGYDLVAFVQLVTSKSPHGVLPSHYEERDRLSAIRRAYVQSWIAHPATWKNVDVNARLTADEWTRAAQLRGQFEAYDQDLVHRTD
ncbi:hypothetical protein DEU32_11437 [Curtobacterium sp. AG1037]|uniref:hypothetical protein n=1 Tax=Curtobacterium sp. AG1037 TaxID=2183990 RepID=UPI000E0BBBFE|nr:hypothetical protein [Curtobacterium sp. AG1037]RDH95072.1 hypothetical protein DEU32_11437 [Curtobacterium sp. AG1037]